MKNIIGSLKQKIFIKKEKTKQKNLTRTLHSLSEKLPVFVVDWIDSEVKSTINSNKLIIQNMNKQNFDQFNSLILSTKNNGKTTIDIALINIKSKFYFSLTNATVSSNNQQKIDEISPAFNNSIKGIGETLSVFGLINVTNSNWVFKSGLCVGIKNPETVLSSLPAFRKYRKLLDL
ncbi:MAG: hypothetical protein KKC20_24780 [Proteobacteria bacterium]|nr:hypothetical protein [Pseudomonadota bacterium]